MNPLKIGNIVRVESGRVEVVLTIRDYDLEHEGSEYRVGQLGSYVTVPLHDRSLVGFVTAIGREEIAVADLEPQIIMHVQLLGEIKGGRFIRGINESPVMGDDVWVAVQEDFEKIFGSFDQLLAGSDKPQSFTLGRFALNNDFEVKVLGTEFFGKSTAIVGNSGAGKSCTTAKVLQEAIRLPQCQVVLFDMHGEYRAAFSDENGRLDPNVTYLGTKDLVIPYWLLTYSEMETLLLDESNPLFVGSQVSFLRSATLEYKRQAAKELDLQRDLTLDTPIYFSLEKLKTYAENLNDARYVLSTDQLAFSKLAMRSLRPDEQNKLMREQRCDFNRGHPEGEVPHPLYYGKLLGLVDRIDTRFYDVRYEFLFRPIEHARGSQYFRDVLNEDNTAAQMSSVMEHLIKVLTGQITPRRNLTIIDLSGIPFDVVDITVSVLTRLLFDVNFWTPAKQRHPITLIYEEAHNYIPRIPAKTSFARAAVERVAKEGRKYGVSAMLVSQRPSELSETALAQCNNMVVMRLNNPDDQNYVARVVSDHFAGLIDMLPIMRPGEGFIIGDSVLMPLRTLIDLPRRTPQSGNVDFFGMWSEQEPFCDIHEIIDYWWRRDRQRLNGESEDERSAPEPDGDPAASSHLRIALPEPHEPIQP
ncbi:MAG: ATP-binding protein [bacterium]|nr:ATP-binding protein [bacterium]